MKLLIPPPLLAALCVLMMWIIGIYIPEFSYNFSIKYWLTGGFVICGLALDLSSMRLFMKSSTTINPLSPGKTCALVTTGIYQFTRNPMYMGLLLILTGCAFWFSNFAGFVMLPMFVFLITRLQIMPEEESLQAKFGEEYISYCKNTGRWI